MPTSAEPGRPNRRRPLGRGPGAAAPQGAAEQEALPDPAPSRNRGETPGLSPAPDAEADAATAAAPAPAPAGAAGAPERATVTGPGDAAPRPVGGGSDEAPRAPGRAPGPEGTPASAAAPGPLDGGSDVASGVSGWGDAAAGPVGGGSDGASGVSAGGVAAAGHGEAGSRGRGGFTLRLDNFEGPFDLLLQLISRHKLDVTEVALSKVTDEFMAYIRTMGPDWDLDQTTEFLVVAATLLDLKAARLLPVAEVEDEADLALLEARDLLFARLLQYKAYKRVAEIFQGRAEDEARRYPRTVGLEPHLAGLLPDVVISIGAEGFARLAVRAMQPKAKPQVYVDHIHAPLVSVREQAGFVVALLRARGEATFQELTEDAPDTLTVVARFLALLELYREKAVVLDQEEALRTLTVRWSGGDGDGDAGGPPGVSDEFDRIVEVKE
ncbi:segregation/condensation protein A [Streptomyces goshikiensis]|uniref:segregation/condensation protein A n=1 Tax=Streptomyces goshikiensis TaxID=1942 RepID=UPI0022F37DB0|nr:segregation/condensation protein A [Streptomyces goshikiensis]WBY19540.1 segregation/condensation protein A [Streptomyces goshikiensis]